MTKLKKLLPSVLFGRFNKLLLSLLIVAMGEFWLFPAISLGGASSVSNTDWPQWKGPNRDSVSHETNLALDWDAQPPREMWTAEVGNGLSCVVVVKDRAYTMGWTSNHGGEDTVWCFNAETGAVIWKQSYPNYDLLSPEHGIPTPKSLRGPNSTPCVDGDRLYTSTSSGKACCFQAESGELLWERDLRTETGADRNDKNNSMGGADLNTASPLVIGDVVVFGVGNSGVAVDKITGKIRWGWGSGGGETVASPIYLSLDGVDYVGVGDAEHRFHITDVKTGKELKSITYPESRYTSDPLFSEGNLILNNACFSTKDWQKLWKVKDAAYGPNIVSNGFLYLCNQYDGQLSCIDIKDGSVKASAKISVYNTYIMAQGKLLALGCGGFGGGDITVVQAGPDGIKVEGKLKLPEEKILNKPWNQTVGQGYLILPSISDGRLFVRGQLGRVTAYDIRGPGHPKYVANRPAVSPTPVTSPVLLTSTASKPTDQDWPQARGPLRNGIAPANNLRLDWTKSQPRQLWQTNVGPAFSSVTMVGDRIYTVGYNFQKRSFYFGGQGTSTTTISCIDALSGKTIWWQIVGLSKANSDFQSPNLSRTVFGSFPYWNYKLLYFGSHATPTIDGDRLYMLDQSGNVQCLNTADGTVLWQKDLVKEMELEFPEFFFSGSPLVLDKALVISAGNSGIALDKETGKVLWSTGKEACGGSSPVLFTQGGKPSLAIFSKDKLVSLAPETGTPLWSYNWVDGYGRNLCDPVPAGDDQLLVFGAKGKGAALLRAGSDKPVWEQKALDPLMGTPVLFQGYIYGPSQSKNGLVCLNAKTGAVQWTSEPMDATQVILSGETLVIQCKNGDLRLAKASPQSYIPLGSYHALKSDSCFASPIIAHDKLICRSWEGDIVALDLANLDPIPVPPEVPALTKSRFLELQTQLGAPTKAKRQAAIEALLKASDKEVTLILPAILETIKGGSWIAQDAAAQLLQQWGGRAQSVGSSLVPLIQANIKNHDWAVVAILLETLKKVDPTSLALISQSIQEIMGDSDIQVKMAAAQFLDRVPFTDGLADVLFAQTKEPNSYSYLATQIRRLVRVDPTASEKLLPRLTPILEAPKKEDQYWRIAIFFVKDLGFSAHNAIPSIKKFDEVAATSNFPDAVWIKIYVDDAIRQLKLVENSKEDPLCRYAYINIHPTAKDMQLTCAAGQSLSAKLDCTDPDDLERNLTATVITNPAHGKVKITGLTMEYQPEAGYVGKDTFTWKGADRTDDSKPASMTIQVQ